MERFNKIVEEKYTINTFKNFTIFNDILKPFYSNDKGKVCTVLNNEETMETLSIDLENNIVVHNPEILVERYFKKSNIIRDKTTLFLAHILGIL